MFDIQIRSGGQRYDSFYNAKSRQLRLEERKRGFIIKIALPIIIMCMPVLQTSMLPAQSNTPLVDQVSVQDTSVGRKSNTSLTKPMSLVTLSGRVVERDSIKQMSPLEAIEVQVSVPKRVLSAHIEKTDRRENSGSSEIIDSVILSTLTDVDGQFSISLQPATYHLTYRQLGNILRRDTIKLAKSVNIGDIVIDLQSIKLKEVVVKAQKKLLTYEKGSLNFNVVESPYAEGFNAKDVLQHMPGMDPDPNKLSMIGKDGLIVLINGRRTNLNGEQLKHYLQSIESDKIERVEIQTNPSPEYSASGNPGVINIILKKNAYLGWDGSISATYMQQSKPTAYINGSINYSNKHLSLRYSPMMGYSNMHGDLYDEYNYGDTTMVSDKMFHLKNNFFTSQRLVANIFITKNIELGFFSSFYVQKIANAGFDSKNHTISHDSLISSFLQTSIYTNKNTYFSISPYFEWRFDDKGKKMTVSYDYSLQKPYISQTSVNNVTNSSSTIVTNSKTFSHTGRIDFKLPFSWLGFEFGGSYMYTKDHLKSDYDGKEDSYGDIEKIGAFYVDIHKSWDKFNFKVGTRYEHTTFEGLPNDTMSFKTKYGNWFPFVDLGFNIKEKHIITLGYNRKIGRPHFEQYNPVRFYFGNHYFQGNPNLKPTIKDNVELKYMFSNLYVSLEYNHGQDGIVTINSVESDSVTSTSYGNGLTFHRAGGTVSYSYYHKRFSLSGGGTAYYYKYHSSNSRVSNEDMKGWSPRLFINGSFNIGKYMMLTANYWCDLKGFGGVFDEDIPVRNQFKHSFDIGANWKFLDGKLVLDVRVQDIFGTNISRHRSNLVDQQGRKYVHFSKEDYESRSGMITLTYRFGNNKTKQSNVDVQIGNDRIGGR